MSISDVCFWFVAISLGLTVFRSLRSCRDPESCKERVIQVFELPEWRFWLGIVRGVVFGLALLSGFWYARFKWLWLTLGVLYLLTITGLALFVLFTSLCGENEISQRKVSMLEQAHRVAEYSGGKACVKLLQSALVLLLWLMAW